MERTKTERKPYQYRPFDSSPGLGRGSCSGFRPMSVLEGATGLPVGLHLLCATWKKNQQNPDGLVVSSVEQNEDPTGRSITYIQKTLAQLTFGRDGKKSPINTENVIALVVQEVSYTRHNFYHAIRDLGRRAGNIVPIHDGIH